MKVIIIGASGQLGREIASLVPGSLLTYNSTPIPSGVKLDVSNELQVSDFILKNRPDVIINTSAITNVDKCEEDRELAYKVNAVSAKFITRSASVVGAYLVHISTDYVFDGEKGMYKEDDLPNPVNYYGLTKLLGETYVLSYDLSLVIRTSGVFGSKSNFPTFVMENLKRGNPVKVVRSIYSPIHAKMLAKAIVEILPQRRTGILNIAGERISREDLALMIARKLGAENLISVVPDSEMKWKARRPRDSSLDISRAKSIISFDFYDTEKNLMMGV
ncbi:SDR family oxidoreductase [Sulfuracidifex tepidarius]|uniref:SDR family oxidoreductase n=1 Tax=Sulfuracidifex tepidarius TaxID=1294262 RepID=UPI0006D25CD3|nr:SDR family oxidoreductase [Sulfuracidifex tepidarius]